MLKIPEWLAQANRRMPVFPPSLCASLLVNHLMIGRGHAPSGMEDGQCVELEVLDLGARVRLVWQQSRFVPARSEQPQVRIAATADDFLKLARREEDPDTLFFQRRLLLDGDTELGLRLKNWLDSLEMPAWLTRLPV